MPSSLTAMASSCPKTLSLKFVHLRTPRPLNSSGVPVIFGAPIIEGKCFRSQEDLDAFLDLEQGYIVNRINHRIISSHIRLKDWQTYNFFPEFGHSKSPLFSSPASFTRNWCFW